LFGEIALIDGRKRSATAIAISKVSVLVLEASDFDRELEDLDPVISDTMKIMLDFVRAVPPRDTWPDGKMPQLSADISHEKVSRVLLAASGKIANIENVFLAAIYRQLSEYVFQRMPKQGA
jgi:CRP-like cAMP-binding protein